MTGDPVGESDLVGRDDRFAVEETQNRTDGQIRRFVWKADDYCLGLSGAKGNEKKRSDGRATAWLVRIDESIVPAPR